MTATVVFWMLTGASVIVAGVAWYYTIQTLRSAQRVREIREGRR